MERVLRCLMAWGCRCDGMGGGSFGWGGFSRSGYGGAIGWAAVVLGVGFVCGDG